jgi:hypothetical protein
MGEPAATLCVQQATLITRKSLRRLWPPPVQVVDHHDVGVMLAVLGQMRKA